jgi:hypothetical protein
VNFYCFEMAEKQEIAELGEVHPGGADHRDEAALARVGKKTVLKVCSHFSSYITDTHVDVVEKIWLSCHIGL